MCTALEIKGVHLLRMAALDRAANSAFFLDSQTQFVLMTFVVSKDETCHISSYICIFFLTMGASLKL